MRVTYPHESSELQHQFAGTGAVSHQSVIPLCLEYLNARAGFEHDNHVLVCIFGACAPHPKYVNRDFIFRAGAGMESRSRVCSNEGLLGMVWFGGVSELGGFW